MLILTRKIDQKIIIAENIVITILGVERDRVKVGIEAPRDVSVLREELTINPRNKGVLGSLMAFRDRKRVVKRRMLA